MPKFQLRDRVRRLENVFDPTSKMRYGRISRIYSKTSRYGDYPELYDVEWEDGAVGGDFLPYGLQPAEDWQK
jgi:hypothetical protein